MAIVAWSAAYGEAIERDDQKPKFYLTRAQAYARIEELKRALEDYQKAATFYSETEQWELVHGVFRAVQNRDSQQIVFLWQPIAEEHLNRVVFLVLNTCDHREYRQRFS